MWSLHSFDSLKNARLERAFRRQGLDNYPQATRPYNASQISGSTTPSLPTIAPPPPTSQHCNVVAAIIVIAVEVVVTYFYGPVAGNLAGQAAGNILGVQDGVNYKSLAVAAISEGVSNYTDSAIEAENANDAANATATVGSDATEVGVTSASTASTFTFGEDLLRGAIQYTTNVVASKLVGASTHFSWAGFVANSAGYAAGEEFGTNLRDSKVSSNFAGNVASVATTDVVDRELGIALGDDHVPSWKQIGIDVGGAALGNAAAAGLSALGVKPVNINQLVADSFKNSAPTPTQPATTLGVRGVGYLSGFGGANGNAGSTQFPDLLQGQDASMAAVAYSSADYVASLAGSQAPHAGGSLPFVHDGNDLDVMGTPPDGEGRNPDANGSTTISAIFNQWASPYYDGYQADRYAAVDPEKESTRTVFPQIDRPSLPVSTVLPPIDVPVVDPNDLAISGTLDYGASNPVDIGEVHSVSDFTNGAIGQDEVPTITTPSYYVEPGWFAQAQSTAMDEAFSPSNGIGTRIAFGTLGVLEEPLNLAEEATRGILNIPAHATMAYQNFAAALTTKNKDDVPTYVSNGLFYSGTGLLDATGLAGGIQGSLVKATGAAIDPLPKLVFHDTAPNIESIARTDAEKSIPKGGTPLSGTSGNAVANDTAVRDIVPNSGVPPQNPNAYSVAYEMKLNPSDFGKSRSVQFNRANASLDAALQGDHEFASMMEQLVPGVQNSVSSIGGRATPIGWTWEHASSSTAFGEQGVMRLVPNYQHTPGSAWWRALHPDAGAAGGYSEWAIPNGAPKN